ncbi:MAG: 4-hydroxybenzoate octaprenyltransferase [Phycisphaerae bacterium]
MTTTVSPATPAATSGLEALRAVASDIKLAHSVFALPFAVLGAFLARQVDAPWSWFAGQMALVIVCMVSARTWAMVVNRIADRRLDAQNPRTSRRAFASGRVTIAFGWAALAACAGIFFAGAAGFWLFYGNAWPVILAAPVLGVLALYSFTKRFTWLCHLFLGLSLSLSPIAAAIAVDPASLFATPALWWICGMVIAWVAGFDIIYALQDVDVDRAAALWSVPSRLGVPAAIRICRGLHAIAAACLVMAWMNDGRLGWLFGGAVIVVGLLLIVEHAVLAVRGKAGLEMAFFTINGIVSCVLGAAGCIDTIV